jgi:hypothetical protein
VILTLRFKQAGRLRWLILVGLVLGFLASQIAVQAFIGLGGFSSEKLVERSGTSDSSLIIGRSGVGDSSLVLSLSPIVSTLDATNVFMDVGTHATLRGDVTDLNDFPSAEVWFEWGYDNSLGNIAGTQTVNTTGVYTHELTGYNPDKTVYFRAVVQTDGISRGEIRSFKVTGSIPAAYRMAQVLSYAWVGVVALAVLAMFYMGVPLYVVLLIGAVGALLGPIGVQAILEALRSWW